MTLYEVLELFLPEYFLGTDILYPMRSYPMRLEISSRTLEIPREHFILIQDVNNRGIHVSGEKGCENSLYFLCNFFL